MLNVYFLKAVGFNHPLLFFRSQRESKSTSASAVECGGPRPSVPPHFYFLYELLSSLPSPGSGDDWGGGPQRPEGSHKDNMAMSLGNNIAEESSKGGDASVVNFGASKIICCIIAISWFCVWTNVIWLLYQHTHISR